MLCRTFADVRAACEHSSRYQVNLAAYYLHSIACTKSEYLHCLIAARFNLPTQGHDRAGVYKLEIPYDTHKVDSIISIIRVES